MRIPRDVSADQLVKALQKFGYFVSHQKGSHIRRDHNPEWPASRNHSKPHHSGRGVESPDRADALIGAVMIGPGSDPYVLNPKAHQSLLEMMQELTIRNEEDPWRVDRIVF
jgi:predicted RNA binding protein YcfA (HicA-like mRNA interferase family)